MISKLQFPEFKRCYPTSHKLTSTADLITFDDNSQESVSVMNNSKKRKMWKHWLQEGKKIEKKKFLDSTSIQTNRNLKCLERKWALSNLDFRDCIDFF